MSVLNRRLFNKGGRVRSSRGVGITSGLVNQPVQKFAPGGEAIKEKYNTTLDALRSLDIVPERKPFNKFQNAAPAALDFFGGLMSNKSYQDGLGGGLDIAGQSIKSSSPLFAQALKNKQEYDATDPEAGLKNMALELALKDKDTNLKTSTKVYGKFGQDEGTENIGFGFRDVYEDGTDVYKYGGKTYTAEQFTLLQEPPKDTETKVFEDENYKVTIGTEDNAQSYTTLGNQVGDNIFIVDPRPDSPTFGDRVNITTIPELQIFKSKQAQFLSIEDELKLAERIEDIKEKSKIAGETYTKIQKRAESATSKIVNYNKASAVLNDATTGTFATQRAGFIKMLETFNVDELSPNFFTTVKNALQTNNTVGTEVLNAVSQKAFINNAQEYDDRLNQTEVTKIADADFNILLSTEGSRLMIDINKAQEQIYADAGKLNNLLSSDLPDGALRALKEFPELEETIKSFTGENGTLSLINSTNIVEKYVTDKLLEFGNSDEIKNRINSVLDLENVGDDSYFLNLENVELKDGHVFNPGQANKEKKIEFLGYANSDGFFEFRGNSITVGDVNKPIYGYTYEKGGSSFVQPLQF
jgi:hypothetical protein